MNLKRTTAPLVLLSISMRLTVTEIKKMAGNVFYFQITLQKSSCFSVGWEGLDLQSIPKAEIHSPVKDVKSSLNPVQIAKNPDFSVLKSNPTDL